MQLAVRFATIKDTAQLKRIWEVCFGDTSAYIDLFFKNRFDPNTTAVACYNSQVVGVVYMLPAMLGTQKFMYGYAIGVLPEFRGNNICENMHDFIRQRAAQERFLYGLHPANEKLSSFYRRIGLLDLYSLRVFDASSCEENENFFWKGVDSKTYFSIRERAYNPIVSWDESMIAYMLLEADHTGGFTKIISVSGQDRILLGKMHQNTVYIKETTMTDKEVLRTSGFIKKACGAEHIVFTLPNESRLGEKKPMILGFGEKRDDVYMNLFLD